MRATSRLVVLVVLAGGAAAEAQYFGRNKVQYARFDFRVMRSEHFDVYYYPEEAQAAEHATRMAERWYARLSRLLDHTLSGRQPLILYASHPHFQQTNALPGAVGEGTGGATEILKRRIVLPLAGPLADTDHVIGHELVHAFQFDITGEGSGSQIPTAVQLPLWFIEGMAEYLSVGPVDAHTAMWMRDAARSEKLPAVGKLDDPRLFPYRYGQAFWAYVAGRWGDDAVGEVLKAAGDSANAEQALEEVLAIDMDTLSKDWHAAIREHYGPSLDSKKDGSAYGRAVVTEKNGGRLNVAPALSPDGRRLVFLSEKDLFSIEMFLADAHTGRVQRKIVETAVDPHFESLQFISSAGSWDARGRRFAFAAVTKGKPVLSILDVETGRVELEVPFPTLGEIYSPTWSPDGRRLAFSANQGGLTDLYLYDLAAKRLQRLTHDAFADIQPSWSPDGRRIAFASDRFSTRMAELDVGRYGLALLELEGGAIAAVQAFDGAKNINPQWSPEGGELLFLSDRGGITNVYRLDLAGGRILQVTDVATGVSGITATSPALSVAASSGRVVFSAYEDGAYRLYCIDDGAVRVGTTLAAAESPDPAALPPLRRERPQLARALRSVGAGLPPASGFEKGEYKPRLTLDYVSQPYVAAGMDRYGAVIGGGASLYWSDMLGNHNLGTYLQANGTLKDIGGAVSYANLKTRWNWGGVVEQLPFVTGSFGFAVRDVAGQPAAVEEVLLLRQTNRSLLGVTAYPLDRSHRFEMSAGFTQISFDREYQTRTVSLGSGLLLAEERRELDAPASLQLGQAAAAFVHDSSTFGATSPILGSRYRFELAPTVGSLDYTGVLADLRHYAMPVRPFTLAFRLLHYGRYGSGGADARLNPVFLGYPGLLRGYGTGSFGAEECGPTLELDCPAFDRLLGTRLALANAELRFPLFGLFGARNLYGPVPIELAAFADAGVAWTAEQRATFLGGERDWVRSVGAAARVNLFGYLVVELDYVRPLDRPRKGWHWELNFRPGF
jgi:Tol biopolymer transport system component